MQTPAVYSDRERVLADLVRQIVDLVHPLRIVLFGSQARGEATEESDIDLMVVVPDGTHRRHTAERIYEHVTGGRVSFDVLVTTPEHLGRYGGHPSLIYRTILEEGRQLYAA